ncbi:hypothetical protein F9K79_03735 [Ochrobactrum sp. Kaboul]|nr:hypothetical protein F9K79_03735 [Ochrobactrum sp. Kaboul]
MLSFSISDILQFVATVLAAGGGAAFLAYKLVSSSAEKIMSHHFNTRLEAFKHEQNQEVERLKRELNQSLERSKLMHRIETEKLPHLWETLLSVYNFAIEQASKSETTRDEVVSKLSLLRSTYLNSAILIDEPLRSELEQTVNLISNALFEELIIRDDSSAEKQRPALRKLVSSATDILSKNMKSVASYMR